MKINKISKTIIALVLAVILFPITIPLLVVHLFYKLNYDDVDQYSAKLIIHWYPIISKLLGGIEANVCIGYINDKCGGKTTNSVDVRGKYVITNSSNIYITINSTSIWTKNNSNKLYTKIIIVTTLAHEMRHAYQMIHKTHKIGNNLDNIGTKQYFSQDFEIDAYNFEKEFAKNNMLLIIFNTVDSLENVEFFNEFDTKYTSLGEIISSMESSINELA